MLALGIRYLNGFVAASEVDDLERAEWPPHPGRVFMALVAAHFQTGADPAEREALLWLEGSTRDGEISPPRIAAPQATQRAVVKHYVPINDKAGPAKAVMQGLPVTRERQDRIFARAWLDEDTVALIWPDLDPPESHRRALEQLCGKVARIGHSSSLVQMWLAGEDAPCEANWLPDEDRAVIRLRLAGPGTLEYLEQEYNAMAVEDYASLKVAAESATDPKAGKAARKGLKDKYGNRPPPQQRPRLSLYWGYAPSGTDTNAQIAAGTIFSPHLITLKLEYQQGVYSALDLVSTLAVVNRFREAIISHSNGESDRVRALLSGHDAGGKPLKDPHLAFLPLPFVGHEHADGHLLGLALVLPDDVSRDERRAALRVIAQIKELKLGSLGVWKPAPVIESNPPWNLRPQTWTAATEGATHWSTVTPIAFDRHPKVKGKAEYQREAAGIIANACKRIGLPEPREVIITPVSAHLGVPPGHAFPRLNRKDGSDRQHCHAILVFDEPVRGPVLIGAGRFRGYGVCRPLEAL